MAREYLKSLLSRFFPRPNKNVAHAQVGCSDKTLCLPVIPPEVFPVFHRDVFGVPPSYLLTWKVFGSLGKFTHRLNIIYHPWLKLTTHDLRDSLGSHGSPLYKHAAFPRLVDQIFHFFGSKVFTQDLRKPPLKGAIQKMPWFI